MEKTLEAIVNASLSPIKHSPPANTVGVVMLMDENMKLFKFAFHSLLSFTDYPYMLTVVECMQPLSTRNYLKAVQKNHPINVLSYNDRYDEHQQADLGLKYMFMNASVRFGVVIGNHVIVEPEWLSGMIARLMSDEKVGAITTSALCVQSGHPDLVVFPRRVYETVGEYDKDFIHKAETSAYQIELSRGVTVHKMNGGKK